MSEQSRVDIEKLANEILEKIHPYDNWVGSVNDLEQFVEAATAEANKRIEALESEVAESDFVIKKTTTLLAEICLILKGDPPEEPSEVEW